MIVKEECTHNIISGITTNGKTDKGRLGYTEHAKRKTVTWACSLEK